jgi:hypothetical protein
VYQGPVHTYLADPVFEVTLYRWRRGSRFSSHGATQETRYLRVRDGLEFVVPERRVTDLGLPLPQGTAPAQPRPPERFVDPSLLPAVSHPEVLQGGAVLPRIQQWLAEQHLLRSQPGRPQEYRPSLLLQELEASFSSEALLTQFHVLTTSGVTRWLPVPSAFGVTRYLWVKVTAEIGPALSQLDRPDAWLMTRAESAAHTGEDQNSSTSTALGGNVRIRAGESAWGCGGGWRLLPGLPEGLRTPGPAAGHLHDRVPGRCAGVHA